MTKRALTSAADLFYCLESVDGLNGGRIHQADKPSRSVWPAGSIYIKDRGVMYEWIKC